MPESNADLSPWRTEVGATGLSRLPLPPRPSPATPAAAFAVQDAERRDFTVNALFYNVSDDVVEDLTGRGADDLAARVLRTPLPPLTTFLDDPLRVLRAVRFSARLGFALLPDVRAAAADDAVRAALAGKVAEQIFDNARVAAGLLEDPREMLARMNELLAQLLTSKG